MKQELMTQLVKELFDTVDELHQEYQDNDIHYVIDAQKTDNKLNITVTLDDQSKKDKKEFEKYIEDLDDDIYQEAIDSFDNVKELDDLYKSQNYKEAIKLFKDKVTKIAENRIKYFQKFLG